jgi:hypothetical protein
VKLAKSVTAGEYDVSVDDAPTSPNQKEANWAIIAPLLPMFKDQLVQQPELLIMFLEYSPLPSPLVAGIKRIILQKQNDPAAKAEAQKAKEIAVAKLLAEISKDDSIANMNNAKAGAQQGTAAYDLAVAANMEHDHAIKQGQLLIAGKKADADAVVAHAKAAATLAGIHHDRAGVRIDAANAHTKRVEAVHKMTQSVGKLGEQENGGKSGSSVVMHHHEASSPHLEGALSDMAQAMRSLAEAHKAPRRIVKDGNGRPVGIVVDQG